MKNPEVSVIISTFNRAEKFLPRAIKSVIDQSFKDWELIIVDDCSTDNTEKVVKSFQTEDKIKYIKLPRNFGSDGHPKNEGIKHSIGNYIAYLDDDCEFLPYHLEKLLAKLKAKPELDVVYCDMWLYDADKPDWEGSQGIALGFDSQFLLNRNFIDTSEVLHKREIVFRVGGWDETLVRFKDWNLWVRMMKAGAKFERLPMIASNYYTHSKNISSRVKVESWYDKKLGMTMFKPTFDPAGCFIYLPYLGYDREDEKFPRVAIYTITYDRLDYTKRMFKSMKETTKYPFDWFVFDNGSRDGTQDWITKQTPFACGSTTNRGISYASNYLLDKISELSNKMSADGYQIIIKVDNDCEFMTAGWLEAIIDLWKRNHKLYISPYVEGLVHNPGGAPRVGYSFIGPYFVEVTYHIGGLFAAIWSKAYKSFRWTDKFLHGNQDREASLNFTKQGYMPMYLPLHRVMHMDSTSKQQEVYPEYFERRKKEKITQYEKDK